MTVIDSVLKAADLIAERGHTRGEEVDENGLCLLGAISLATRDTPYVMGVIHEPLPQNTRDVIDAVAGTIQRNTRHTSFPQLFFTAPDNRKIVWMWNDHVCDGAEDAIQLLKETAHRLESEETP